MTNERRKKASQKNGAKSHGPTSEEGKWRSARNALKHGMCASIETLSIEDPERYRQSLEEHIKLFQPRNGVEMDLVRTMVMANCALDRGWLAQTGMLEEVFDSLPHSWPDGKRFSHAFINVDCMKHFNRYERQWQMARKRAIDELFRLRNLLSPALEAQPDQLLRPKKPASRNEPNPRNGHPKKDRIPARPAARSGPNHGIWRPKPPIAA
jgi:hypothetical protein